MKKYVWTGLLIGIALFLSCSRKGHELPVVKNFDVNRYSGQWYELARIDNKFEKGLNNVTATYTVSDNNTINVLNRGFNPEKGEWKEANGTAKFREAKDVAKIKVSFFGPFYSDYNVIALDDDYQNALVAGGDFDYLWILSRNTAIPENLKQDFMKKATALGYDTNRLIWVKQNKE